MIAGSLFAQLLMAEAEKLPGIISILIHIEFKALE
jgi:hypothetical protein